MRIDKKSTKRLKFSSDLVNLILSGRKTTTWRLWDDKEIQKGDIIKFVEASSMIPFAIAEVVEVRNKTMSTLDDRDKEGHEPFYSDKAMYDTYTNYYGRRVLPQSPVKIVKFRTLRKRDGGADSLFFD